MRTFRRHKEKDSFLNSILQRLYCIYDILLNTLTSHHLGIYQQANTDELVMNYHNIGTVFAVTSKAGITPSLKLGKYDQARYCLKNLASIVPSQDLYLTWALRNTQCAVTKFTSFERSWPANYVVKSVKKGKSETMKESACSHEPVESGKRMVCPEGFHSHGASDHPKKEKAKKKRS